MSFNTGMKAGTFLSLERLVEADIRSGVVKLVTGETYAISDTNNSGVALNNGFFANPIETPQTGQNATDIAALQAAVAQLEEDMARSFRLVEATATEVLSSGASGTIRTITTTSTQKAVITYLATVGTSVEGDISINSGAENIASAVSLVGSDTPNNLDLVNRFGIGGQSNNHISIEGAVGDDVTIVKDSGSTSNNIVLAYEIWEEV